MGRGESNDGLKRSTRTIPLSEEAYYFPCPPHGVKVPQGGELAGSPSAELHKPVAH